MHIRCPHCLCPTEIAEDSTLHDVECSSCGSAFSLVGDEITAPYHPGTSMIGHFELLEQLGVGAFGTVWKAHDRQLDRTVAIKVPRKDQLSSKEAEQFLREARSAAQLKHPSIVSVHEVGREQDQLYIVSDFVEGATLSEWIKAKHLTFHQTAELCAKIAEALHHAHESGVIHRDLKPGNIMMDVEGEPHIMDFGLAKREAAEITMTVEGKVLGTPAYMPPEQARGEGHKADARSDVYALGVILFQLLTGELPFRGNPRMLIVQILKDDPPSPRKFNGSIPRDLETICLKCLEKEPHKRYASGLELKHDLMRFLHRKPIVARPITAANRAWKWCRRNRVVFGLGSSVTGLLVVLGATLTVVAIRESRSANEQKLIAAKYQRLADANMDLAEKNKDLADKHDNARERAEIELGKAKAVRSFLNEMLMSIKPEFARGKDLELLRMILDNGAKRISELDDQPEIQGQLHTTIGDAYLALGLHSEAETHLKGAVKVYGDSLGLNHFASLTAANNLANLFIAQGRYKEAAPVLTRTLEARTRLFGEQHPETLAVMNNLAMLYKKQGRYDEAEPLYSNCFEAHKQQHGEDHPDTLLAMNNLATLYFALKIAEKAEPLLVRCLELRRRKFGEDHPDTLFSMNNLAMFYDNQEQYDLAAPLLVKTLEIRRRLLGDEHPITLRSMNNLAINHGHRGIRDQALSLFKETLEARMRVLGEKHPDTINSMANLAFHYKSDRQFDRAEDLLLRALELRAKHLGEDHPATSQSIVTLVSVYKAQARTEEIGPLYRRLLDIRQRTRGTEHPDTLRTMNNLAVHYRDSGQYEKAEPIYTQVLKVRRRVLGEEHRLTLISMHGLGVVHLRQGQIERARPLLESALEMGVKTLDESDDLLKRIRDNLKLLNMPKS